MPMIIVEGIDGSGKSTLVERIAELSPVPAEIIHKGPLDGPVESEYIIPIFDITPDKLIIADRWHIGEMIYGPIYRGVSLVNGHYEKIIEDALEFVGAVRLILLPPLEVVKSRLDVRGEDYLQAHHVERVWDEYREYAFGHPQYNLIDREFDTDKLAKEIIESAFEL